MRTIQIDESEQDHTWAWLAAGAALGLVAGVLIARRKRGGKFSLRDLAERAMDNLEPILDIARSFRKGGEEDADDDEEETEADLDAEAAGAELDDVEYDDDDGDDDVDDEVEAEDEEEVVELDARVLEAFANDPVLAERAVEIEQDRDGSIVLHGRVRSDREVKHAITIARGVPGVERVRQRLTVRSRSR